MVNILVVGQNSRLEIGMMDEDGSMVVEDVAICEKCKFLKQKPSFRCCCGFFVEWMGCTSHVTRYCLTQSDVQHSKIQPQHAATSRIATVESEGHN